MRVSDEEIDVLRKKIIEEIDLTRELEDEEVYLLVEEHAGRFAREKMLTLREREELEQFLFHSLRKLDVLQELLEDQEITEIMVNGVSHIFYEKNGRLYESGKRFSSREKLNDVIQQIAGYSNRMVNAASPIVDARLSDGSRVNIVLEPVSIDGAAVSIRKFPEKPFRMEDLIRMEAITEEAAEFLRVLVLSGYNIFISGGTGSGKTTFLNVLSQYIPREERIITIEDSAELQLLDKPNLVRLETRNANTEGVLPITIRDLIRTALRMRPERIVVGECRGEEALDMLQAMNTGHDGSLSTGHANSCRDMISRLETMVLMGMDLPLPAIRSQIASGVDILVHLGRMRDRSRRVLSITEITGMQNGEVTMQELFRFREEGTKNGKVCGRLVPTAELQNTQKCQTAGYQVPEYTEVPDGRLRVPENTKVPEGGLSGDENRNEGV